MWKAAFSGRSETGSVSGRSSSQRKKSSGSSRKPEEESRRSGKSSRGSVYGDEDGTSTYATAPSSRVGEPRGLTESAVGMLENDADDGWEDEDKDARSERRSVRSEGRRHRRKSEKERSRSGSRDKSGKRRGSRKDSEVSRGKSRNLDGGDDRAIPDMGSFSQFPGQYAGGMMGPAGRQEPMMSGALPTPNNQFGLSRADSYGAAADYYQDEGQSVDHQPGMRVGTPNMLVNPDHHLIAASAQAQPAQDTGHGSAADFYNGKASPILTAEPQPITPGKPSSSSRPSKSGKTSSYGTAAAAAATGIGLGAAAGSYSQSQHQTSLTSYQQSSSSSSKPQYRPNRQSSGGPTAPGASNTYYGPPPQQGQGSGTPGKQSSHSNAGLYAAGAATAGLAAYEINQHHQQASHTPSISPYGGTAYGRPPSYGQQQSPYVNGGMQQHQHFHEHKGPITRLKDGLFNLISSEEDTIKMEMYTEYIGVCKNCFDPRTSPNDAPRRHHYHGADSRDSFEELRRRRSIEKMRRSSREQLGRTGSTRVDKDSRYYSDRRKSSSKTDLVGAGVAAAGVAVGANALFNSDRRNFDDTYSIKSGHRESSAARRRSRSSSRERRRRSSHGVIGRDENQEYVTVRTKDGRVERRKAHRSRSRSGDRTSTLMGAAAGAALGASAISAAGHSRRSREHSPNGTFIRRRSHSRSSSGSQGGGGVFGNFFSPPRRKCRGSRSERKKKERGFFSFGNDSTASSDSELAFGASKTDLPLRRKSSLKSTAKRKKSDEHIAATVAGIGATAAALAAAQNGHRVGKRSSRPELGPGRDVKQQQIARKQGRTGGSDDEWEDELPSDVDDASSGSDLAFGDYDKKLSRRQSRESVGSQSSAAGGLGAWGWRWGGKDNKKRKPRRASPQPPSYSPRRETSGLGSAAAGAALGAVAGAALGSTTQPPRADSTYTSTSSIPQQPMQYVDPRPMSDRGSVSGSRHGSIPGPIDSPTYTARPGPAPLQQPKPVAPIQPAFTQDGRDYDDTRPVPRRTQSSPVQHSWGKDAALIGAAAVGTAAVIASQGRKSKDVRFGLTEEQERKHEDERRRERQRADEERRRADRTRALKEEADRYSREQDVLRRREEENKNAAEAELQRQRTVQREADEQAEIERKRERDMEEREEARTRERQERERREGEEARLTEEIERKKRELEDRERRERSSKKAERRQSLPKEAQSESSSSVPWGAVAAGAAAAGVGAVALAEHERSKEEDRESRWSKKDRSREVPVVQEIVPPDETAVTSIEDDPFNDPDYFKRQRSRSPVEYARHVDELARRAADKVVSARGVLKENRSYYSEPAQSQAEFFAPKDILDHRAEDKTRVADPIGDNTVLVYNAEDLKKRNDFGSEWGSTFAKPHSKAPRGVPHLDLITPTPPPDAVSKTRRRSSPPARPYDDEPQAEEGAKKSTRSRSISWGADQTHVYDVPTPEPHVERESYIENHDLPRAGATVAGIAAAGAAAAALHEVVDEPGDDDRKKTYRQEDPARDTKKPSRWDDDDVEDIVDDRDTPPMYRQPFYESVSDIGLGGFSRDSPGTEGAPPVRGFVEGEVDEPTPAVEKAPHIPGGFDDEEEVVKPGASRNIASAAPEAREARDLPAAEPVQADEPSWEPPLSKKDKKKREKATKRSSTLDSYTSSPIVEEPAVDVAPEPPKQPEDDLDAYMSKKDKKKRDKALKRGMSEDQSPIPAMTEPTDTADEPVQASRNAGPEPDRTWEPPLSKKEKKKREKGAKKQGFADVADSMMTAGGIAAVAGAAGVAADEFSEPPSSKKGNKGRKSRGVERDMRDIEPTETVMPEPATMASTERDPFAMPGGWDSDTQARDATSPTEVVDPFQFQIHEDSPPSMTSQEVDPATEFTAVRSSKESKRDSLKYNEPPVSSPSRAEVPSSSMDEDRAVERDTAAPATNGYTTSVGQPSYASLADVAAAAVDNRSTQASEYDVDDRPLPESTRRISPDDLRSVASDPTGDRLQSKSGKSGSEAQYYDEPETYDDGRSVAASEPVDAYETTRKSKRRSRREDDDTVSVTSSRSKREKDEPTSKDKRSGFFGGLFGRKSTDNVPKSEGAALSRTSTRDSKDDDGEDGERRHRRRKHRSSEYGDDDDTRSVISESSRKHRSRSEREEDDREKHRSSQYGEDDYDVRNGDERHRHHHRRRTDESEHGDSYERSSHRHHHRRRTDEELDDKDQSFLGMRVEDTPPLPVSRRESLDSATLEQEEQGHGNLVSTEPETHIASRDHADAFDLVRQETDTEHQFPRPEEVQDRDIPTTAKHLSFADDVDYFPSLPESRPGSPTELSELDATQRQTGPQRPTSTTAVPLRFPFGHQPLTPSTRMERAASFGGSLPSSPATPMSTPKQRQGRPASTEIRPLYLVERNRKTPEVEEMLPSLPSSMPSSRASSMIGSDEYESAAEDVGSPERRRNLTIDTDQANMDWDDAEYLDSQQTTPRATHRPDLVPEKPSRQEPQFYTWEDYAQDERLHNTASDSGTIPEAQEHMAMDQTEDRSYFDRQQLRRAPSFDEELPALPPSRPQSRTESRPEATMATGAIAAAALGGAAVLGYQALKGDDDTKTAQEVIPSDPTDSRSIPEAEPMDALGPLDENLNDEDSAIERPTLARSGSSKKSGKKAKKVKKNTRAVVEEDEMSLPSEAAPALISRDTDGFLADESLMEEGRTAGQVRQVERPHVGEPNELDSFIHEEERLEAGEVGAEDAVIPAVDFSDAVLPLTLTNEPDILVEPAGAHLPTLDDPFVNASRAIDESVGAEPAAAPVLDSNNLVSEDARLNDQPMEDAADAEKGEDLDHFMEAEEQLEAGQPTTSVPEPAPTFSADQDVEMDSRSLPSGTIDKTSHDTGQIVPSATIEDVKTQPTQKLSKKEKRKLKQLREAEEAELQLEAPESISPAPETSAVLSEDRGLPTGVPSMPDDTVDKSVSETAPVAAAATTEDSRPSPTRKPSKKEKRKQKAAGKFAWDEPVEPEPSVESQEDMVDQPTDVMMEDVATLPKDVRNEDYILPTVTKTSSQDSASLFEGGRSTGTGIEPTLKASSSTLTSTAAAMVHTSLDPVDSTAEKRLSTTLEDGTADADMLIDEPQQRELPADIEQPAESVTEERPILQPESEEPWETRPTVSRKKNRKDKKEQRQQSIDLETETQHEHERSLPNMEAVQPSGMTDGDIQPTEAILGDKIDASQPLLASAMDDYPENIALPPSDDHDLEPDHEIEESAPTPNAQATMVEPVDRQALDLSPVEESTQAPEYSLSTMRDKDVEPPVSAYDERGASEPIDPAFEPMPMEIDADVATVTPPISDQNVSMDTWPRELPRPTEETTEDVSEWHLGTMQDDISMHDVGATSDHSVVQHANETDKDLPATTTTTSDFQDAIIRESSQDENAVLSMQPGEDDTPAIEETFPANEQEPEFSGTAPSKKKGRKGNAFVVQEEPSAAPSLEGIETVNTVRDMVDDSQSANAEASDDFWSPLPKKRRGKRGKKGATSTPPIEETRDVEALLAADSRTLYDDGQTEQTQAAVIEPTLDAVSASNLDQTHAELQPTSEAIPGSAPHDVEDQDGETMRIAWEVAPMDKFDPQDHFEPNNKELPNTPPSIPPSFDTDGVVEEPTTAFTADETAAVIEDPADQGEVGWVAPPDTPGKRTDTIPPEHVIPSSERNTSEMEVAPGNTDDRSISDPIEGSNIPVDSKTLSSTLEDTRIEEPEFVWTAPASKKKGGNGKKKGRNGKKSKNAPSEPETVGDISQSSAPTATSSASHFDTGDTVTETSRDITASEQTTETEANDIWAPPTKSKKGKKGEQSSLLQKVDADEPREAAPPLEPIQSATTEIVSGDGALTAEAMDVDPAEDWVAHVKGKRSKRETLDWTEPTVDELLQPEQPQAAEQVVETSHDVQDQSMLEADDTAEPRNSGDMDMTEVDQLPPLPESPTPLQREVVSSPPSSPVHPPAILHSVSGPSLDDARTSGLVGEQFSYHPSPSPTHEPMQLSMEQNHGSSQSIDRALTPGPAADDLMARGVRSLDAGILGAPNPMPKPLISQTFDGPDQAANVPLPEDADFDLLTDTQMPEEKSTDVVMEDNAAASSIVTDQQLDDSRSRITEQRDIEFSSDVASGLTHSGFDPGDFVNDPAFQRRLSPPGMVAEADPEEVFTTTASKKKKKGNRGKRDSTPLENIPDPEITTTVSSADLEPAATQPTDDFNETLEKGLAGTGFDAALLQQAASSSNDVSSNEITGDDVGFSFATKRKKGNRSKKAQHFEATDESLDAAETLPPNRDLDGSRQPDSDHYAISRTPTLALPGVEDVNSQNEPSVSEENVPSIDPKLDMPTPMNEDKERGLHLETEYPSLDFQPPQAVAIDDPASHFVIAGDREMDVDEMDRAYKSFKKNKRNKKKRKENDVEGDEQPPAGDTTLTATKPRLPEAAPEIGVEEHSDTIADESTHYEPQPLETAQPSFASDEEYWSRTAPPRDFEQQASDKHGEMTEYVTTAAGLSAAAAAAAGLTHVHSRDENEGVGEPKHFAEDSSPQARDITPEIPREHSGPAGTWSLANLEDSGEPLPESPLLGHKIHEIARDSGYQEANTPILQRRSVDTAGQDIPVVRATTSHESLSSRRSAEPLRISTDTVFDWGLNVPKSREQADNRTPSDSLHARTASRETDDTPLESTTKNRASYLFQTTPENLKDIRTPAGHDSPTPREGIQSSDYFHYQTIASPQSPDTEQIPIAGTDRSAFSPPPTGTMSPRMPLDPIPEEQNTQKRSIAETDLVQPQSAKAIRRTQTPQAIRARERALSPTSVPPLTIPAGSSRSVSNPLSTDELLNRLPWPAVAEDNDATNIESAPTRKRSRQTSSEQRSPSAMSNRSNFSAGQFRSPEELRSFSRTSNRSSTPTLRRISLSGDLRAASRRGDAGSAVSANRSSPKTIPFEAPPTPPSNDDEVMDGGASRSVDMSDVYQGMGDAQASQVSPTRPPSMRKRQSMHIVELESRLDQLAAENQALQSAQQGRDLSGGTEESEGPRDVQLQEKDVEISGIRAMLEPMQDEISRLNEINAGLTEANRNLVDDSNSRYAALQEEHGQTHEQWQSTSRELDSMRQEHDRLNVGMREIVEAEIASKLVDKNAEIRQLREELDVASEQIRSLQVQIQSSRARDYLQSRDEDYFDGACQKLCQHVQQWVLRFSKLSDKLVCRLSTDLKDEKIEARLDNAILDGSDVDKLLGDRTKRRDVFMSVVMTMVWEYVFTRYLFGMDREQRQKLKNLEKLLAEVGPPRAVAQWRATTLTLLSKRPAFAELKVLDTKAVANEIFGLLCALLPPPSSAEDQLMASLLRVIGIAVDLSIEMRIQRAEYIMLPPLQPEYDTNGDLVRKVHFNASLMNERSGMFSSNEELEESSAVVKIVLFPLVVKKGDENGEGEEEIVVCPAQVLVHNDNGKGKKIVRVQSGAMEIDDPRRSMQSLISAQGSTAF